MSHIAAWCAYAQAGSAERRELRGDMPPPGGLSDKIGNRYEGRLAVWRLLQLLDEQHPSVRVRFEKPGDDHFEWWVEREDGIRVYAQVKRQQAPDQEWKIGTLVARGVLPAFGERLCEEPSARCEFLSTLSASHLQDLTESALLAEDLGEFEARFVAAADKAASWKAVCRGWPGITAEESWRLLQRITVGIVDERTLRDALHAHARALVAAPAADVVARLGDFLDDHLAQELTAQDVWDFLRNSAHFEPTDWIRNDSIHAKIHDITSRYRDGIATDRGPLAEIHRSAADQITEFLAVSDGPAVLTVAADAGLGKTGLMGQVLSALDGPAARERQPIVLAARLDRLGEFRDAPGLGAALSLPGSPAAVLSRVAAGRPALLVLDQVDAFGAGSGRNPARLEAVTEVLREARALGVQTVIACRAFDLEVDDRLAALAGITGKGRHAEGHHVEHLGLLPSEDVDKALHDVGIKPGSLTPPLRELLRTPLHLRMLVTLQQRGEIDPAGITTRLQLFSRFYRAVCHEVEARQPGAPVTAVTDRLAGVLSDRQELSVPAALLSNHPVTVEHLVSAGWLRRDLGRLAFAHEAFFDFAYAQRHIRSGISLLDLLRGGEQHLFRRGQVRQILALEREQDRGQYLRDVAEVLGAGDVRPHIKELVIAMVTWVSDPTIEEWHALGALGDVAGNPLVERAHALAVGAPAFSRLLLTAGVIGSYLSDPATADLGAWLCQLLVRAYPDEIAGLLQPYAGQPGWSTRLARVLNAAPLQDSDRVVDLMEATIEAGEVDNALRGLAVNSDFFSLLHGLNGPVASRGSRLVAAWLRRRLTILVADRAYYSASAPGVPPGEPAGEDPAAQDAADRHEYADTPEELVAAVHAAQSRKLIDHSVSAPAILATLAADDPAAFAHHILPVARDAAMASRTGQTGDNGERDEAFRFRPSQEPEHDPGDALLSRLAQAVQAAAGAGDLAVHASVREMTASPLATEQMLAAAGFAAGHPDLLDDAASWLETGPYALAQGWSEDAYGLSAAVIAQVCTQLPPERAQALQKRAAAYTDHVEKHLRHLYGAAAHRLLRDVPPDRLTPNARARLDELNRKFPPPPAQPTTGRSSDRGFVDTSVQSPISLDAVQLMKDDQLINAMRRWSSDEWRPLLDGRIQGGATSFAQVIASAAQDDPQRFTAILESLPEGIQHVYIQDILRALGRSSASPELLLRAVKASQAHTASCGTEIALLIEQVAPHLNTSVLTSAGLVITDVFTLLEQILATHWGQLQQPWTVASGTSGEKLAEQLSVSVWNQGEYPALRSLARLAHTEPQASAMLNAQLSRMSASPHLVHRALAIEIAAIRASQDPPSAIDVVTAALAADGLAAEDESEPPTADAAVLLASNQLRDLLLRMCWPHYGLISAILARMLQPLTAARAACEDLAAAAAGQAAQNAAMIAAVAACRHPEATTLTRRLAHEGLAHRRGIAMALAQLPLTELTSELTTVFTQLLDDPDDDIARAAGFGLHDIPADNDDLARTLLSAACKSRTFTVAPAQVISAVEHYQGHIPVTVLDIASQFFRIHGHQAGDFSSHGFHDASVLGRLVINIYDQEPPTSSLSSRALDLIDAMIFARTYGLEERLAQLDR